MLQGLSSVKVKDFADMKDFLNKGMNLPDMRPKALAPED